MKKEDIDKKIGIPDVDAEWAKFEREVISPKTISRKHLYWGIGLAATIALVTGIFLFDRNAREHPTPTTPLELRSLATGGTQEHPTPTKQLLSVVDTTTEVPTEYTISPNKEDFMDAELQQKTSSELLAEAKPSATESGVYDCGEQMDSFPGGDRALMEFIKTNMHYPDLAMEYGARGRVITTFVVDSLGYTSNYKVARIMRLEYDTLRLSQESAERQQLLKEQIEQQLGEESIRILSLMPRWTPANQFGRFVSQKYAVPVVFRATEEERQTFLAQNQAASDELQGQIAGLTIVPTSADMGPNTMRLIGTRVAGSDSVRIGRKTDYDFLVVVNGQPLSEVEQKQMMSSDFHVYYYNRQQIIDSIFILKDEDTTHPYVEKYGERAKKAVMVVTTVSDTLCDAYVSQHPEIQQALRHVSGIVMDENDRPLADVWVGTRGAGAGAPTDSTGHFSFWIPREETLLYAECLGYVSQRNIPAAPNLTIHLRSATVIREVKVIPKSESLKIR